MSLAVLYSRALAGMDAPPVTVEAHLANGLPSFTIVGLPEAEVKEAKDRVRQPIDGKTAPECCWHAWFCPRPCQPGGLRRLGAFITNPVSLEPRTAAHGVRLIEYPGGFLLHTGYPNPGLRAVLRRYAARWRQLPIPLLVHLLVRTPEEVYRAVLELEKVDGVTGFEIGLPPGCTREQAVALFKAARGEMAVILRLPFENAQELGAALLAAGSPTISLGPPRGILPGPLRRGDLGFTPPPGYLILLG